MASFSTGGIGLNGHMGSTFLKRIGFRKAEIPKNVENCSKMIRNGSRKMIRVSREVRKEQKFVPNALEGLQEARNPLKNSKKVKIQDLPYFSYFSGVGSSITPDQPPRRPLF